MKTFNGVDKEFVVIVEALNKWYLFQRNGQRVQLWFNQLKVYKREYIEREMVVDEEERKKHLDEMLSWMIRNINHVVTYFEKDIT